MMPQTIETVQNNQNVIKGDYNYVVVSMNPVSVLLLYITLVTN